MNGYYVWPRLGFCMKLNEEQRLLARRSGFADAETTHDLFLKYDDDKAAEWWLRYGHSGPATFVVDRSSVHNEILEEYLSAHGVDCGKNICGMSKTQQAISMMLLRPRYGQKLRNGVERAGVLVSHVQKSFNKLIAGLKR